MFPDCTSRKINAVITFIVLIIVWFLALRYADESMQDTIVGIGIIISVIVFVFAFGLEDFLFKRSLTSLAEALSLQSGEYLLDYTIFRKLREIRYFTNAFGGTYKKRHVVIGHGYIDTKRGMQVTCILVFNEHYYKRYVEFNQTMRGLMKNVIIIKPGTLDTSKEDAFMELKGSKVPNGIVNDLPKYEKYISFHTFDNLLAIKIDGLVFKKDELIALLDKAVHEFSYEKS